MLGLDAELDALNTGLVPLLPEGAAAAEVRTALAEAREALAANR